MANAKANVTARVLLETKEAQAHDETLVRLVFVPDYQDGRNAEWARFTPSLRLEMTVVDSVAEQFNTQTPYTLTFSPGEKETK